MDDNFLTVGKYRFERKPARQGRRFEVEVPTPETQIQRHTPAPDIDEILKETQQPHFFYEDHTSDVRVRAQCATFTHCLVSLGVGMVNYMTDISKVEPKLVREIAHEADTLEMLVFHFLDEILYLYGSEYFMTCRIAVKSLNAAIDNDVPAECQPPIDGQKARYRIEALCLGETFDATRHTQGTEVKAITMHDLSISVEDDGFDCAVLLDI